MAVITPDGYIRLVDRTKDLVKSGGEWISSVELENEIMAHPKVKEAAVIGIVDEKWGERPLACVVPEDGEDAEPRRHPRVPRRPGRQVVDPGVVRVHRRGPEDLGRQVLQEDAARAVRLDRDVRAIVLREFGPPERLVPEDVPDPEPRDGEVVLDVEIASITFVETQVRAGRPPVAAMAPELPA